MKFFYIKQKQLAKHYKCTVMRYKAHDKVTFYLYAMLKCFFFQMTHKKRLARVQGGEAGGRRIAATSCIRGAHIKHASTKKNLLKLESETGTH